MNTRQHSQPALSRRLQRGIMLVECLVYIVLFSIVTGFALVIFYKCTDSSRLVKRTADDITSAVTAGEQWRDDLRRAVGPVRVEDSADGPVINIPHADGDVLGAVRYRFANDAVWRQSSKGGNWTAAITRVKNSTMTPDNRHRVIAWRWELELQPRKKYPHTLPLFTFETVPGPNP